MSFKMFYDTRNRTNLDKLADNTKIKAYQLYEYCIDNQIQILIYETIRTKEKQAENVRKGASKTMKSYHIVGQALDWVLVDSKKNALWNGYNSKDAQKVIKYAKSIGFEWGGDWKNFYDAPHLQYEYKGYGSDTYGKNKVDKDVLTLSQYKELLAKIEKLEKEKLDKPTETTNPSLSHKEAWEWMVKAAKLSDGTNAKGYMTREQFASLLKRYHDKFVAK